MSTININHITGANPAYIFVRMVYLSVRIKRQIITCLTKVNQNSLSSRISPIVSPSVSSPSLLDRLFLVRSSPAASQPPAPWPLTSPRTLTQPPPCTVIWSNCGCVVESSPSSQKSLWCEHCGWRPWVHFHSCFRGLPWKQPPTWKWLVNRKSCQRFFSSAWTYIPF